MGASFEEKSVWIQLGALLVGSCLYAAVAARMMGAGVTALPAYMPLLGVGIVVMVLLLAGGHAAAAIAARPEGRDERDRLIEWKAESRSSWVLAAGALGTIACMLGSVSTVWLAHVLLLSLVLSEVLGMVLRLVYYRRGI